MDKDHIAKLICYGLGCILVYYVLMALLPYLAIGFAAYAFGYLVLQENRNNRKRRH